MLTTLLFLVGIAIIRVLLALCAVKMLSNSEYDNIDISIVGVKIKAGRSKRRKRMTATEFERVSKNSAGKKNRSKTFTLISKRGAKKKSEK